MATKAPKRGPAAKSALRSPAPGFAGSTAIAKRRDEIIKAKIFRPAVGQGAPPDEQDPTWEGVGALVPPYEPFTLVTLLEHSNSLRPCVDAYVTNIDACGHRFEPVIDLNAADSDDLVRQYLRAKTAARFPTVVENPEAQVSGPSDEMVKAAKAELSEKMAAEGLRIQHFFDYACLDISFVTLRRRTRQDLEVQGNAYWECIRAHDQSLAGFEYVPAFTMRHMSQDKRPINVVYKVKENQFDYGDVETKKFFRRYVQVYETRVTWFKEFGDPRVLSRRTGHYYKDLPALVKAEQHEDEASEIIHFRVHTSKSSYGIPRWVGTLLSVLGSRQSEEVNLDYFENKSVPPLAILVSGGRISTKTVERVQDFIENDVKGKKNYHKILLLEAESGPANGTFGDQSKMKIELKPLTAAQHNDALFQNYDEHNIDKVGMSFRLPRMLRGDIRDFNRATAEAALDFAESQVFRPERDEFDFMVNRKIFPALGIKFWKFVSNASTTQNVTDLAKIILDSMERGAIIPAEGRDLLEKVFNRPFRKIVAPWLTQPISLTLAGIVPPDDLMAPGMVSPQVAATGTGAPAAPAQPGQPLQVAPKPGAPGPSIAAGAGAGVKLTGTDAASVITVNEARADMGKGPLQLPPGKGGGDDPDGFLTVAEFKALRMSSGQAQGTEEGQDAAKTPSPSQQKQLSPHQQQFQDTINSLLVMRKAIEYLDKQEYLASKAAIDAAAEE